MVKFIKSNRKVLIIIGVALICIMVIMIIAKKNSVSQKEKVVKEYNDISEASIDVKENINIVDGSSGLEQLKAIEEKTDENTISANKSEKKSNKTDVIIDNFVNKAISQLGKGPEANSETVYGRWYQDNVDGSDSFAKAPWCAMFLSWCANQVGISKDVVGYYAECSYWKNEFYVKNNIWHDTRDYSPQRGDLIFFDNHNEDKVADHNGLVEKVDNSQVTVIEGNLNNKVTRYVYNLNDNKILGYGTPKYDNAENDVKADNEKNKPANNTQAPQKADTATTQPTSGDNGNKSQADAIIAVAISQLGTGVDSAGCTKYGYWYSQNIDKSSYFASAPWCAMFVTWCANQAGISTDIITPYAYCGYGIQYFQNKGCYRTRSSGYVPKKGDVIFFGADTHTGLVEYSQNGYVYTVEGNSTGSTVARRSYPLYYANINGYGVPNYQ